MLVVEQLPEPGTELELYLDAKYKGEYAGNIYFSQDNTELIFDDGNGGELRAPVDDKDIQASLSELYSQIKDYFGLQTYH